MKAIYPILIFCLVSQLGFTEGEDDPFDPSAFDQSVQSSTDSKEADTLSALFGANLSLAEQAVLFSSDDTSALTGKARGKVFAKISKPSLGALFASVTFDHTLNLATNNSNYALGYSLQDAVLSDPSLDLSELHYSLDINKVLFIRFGQQIIGWGASYFWSAADFINQSKSDSQAAFDARIGKMGLRLHLPIEVSNLYFFWDLGGGLSENKIYDFEKSSSYTAKFETNLLGFEVGIISKLAPNDALELGGTLSGNILTLDLWAEYGALMPVFDREFEQSFAIGFEKTFADATEIKLRSEFFCQSSGHDDKTISSMAGFTPYYWGKYYIYGYLGFEKIERSNIDLGISTIWNLSDFSSTQKISIGTKLFDQVPIQFSCSYNSGQKDREFTKLAGGNSWNFTIQTNIEF